MTQARPFARVVRAFGAAIIAAALALIALSAIRRVEINRASGSSTWLEAGQVGIEEDHVESSVVRSFRVPAGVRLVPVTRQWGWLPTSWDFPPRRYLTIPLWMIAGAGAIIAGIGHFASRASGTFGHCPECGFDLRAAGDRCPECGATDSIDRAPRSTA